MVSRLRAFFFAAPTLRVLGEMCACYLILISLIFLIPQLSTDLQNMGENLFKSGAIWLAALRLQLVNGRWKQALWHEGSAVLILVSAMALLGLGLITVINPPWFNNDTLIRTDPRTFNGFVAVWLAYVQEYGLARIALLLLCFLSQQRRTHLQWSMTYAILLTLTAFIFLCGGLLMIATLASMASATPMITFPGSDTLAGWGVMAMTIILALVTVAILVLLITFLPAMLLASYFTRRTTLRLQQLAQTARALQAGDLSTRVAVEGEDEVAQLQTSFNAMATDLQRTMDDLAQANQALQTERDAVARLLQERRVLIAGVSHELRTPVATLRGYLESALEHWNGTAAPTLHADLTVMERETIRLQRLLDDLFTLARAEVGQLPMTLAPTDLRVTLQRSVEAVAASAWEQGRIEVIADLPEELPQVLTDEGRFEQIIRNLLRNAVRHTPPGGMVVVSAVAATAAVVVEVKDTGEGIQPDDLPHLFERFYRAPTARERDSSGAGLGLAIVKELTEAMGGSVSATNLPEQGACFSVRLPLVFSL